MKYNYILRKGCTFRSREKGKQGTRRMSICSSVWADVHTSYKVSVAQCHCWARRCRKTDTLKLCRRFRSGGWVRTAGGRAFHTGTAQAGKALRQLSRLLTGSPVSSW